jgi:hypothetical protein
VIMTVDRPEIVTTRVTLRTPSFCNTPLHVSKHLGDGPPVVRR